MTMEAKVAGGEGEGDLNMLDIAKHAVITTINVLGEHDRLSIVQFCRQSRQVFPLTYMDERGRENAIAAVRQLAFGNGTNLWNGISQGLQALETRTEKTRMAHIMLLTDGETESEEEVMTGLKAYKAKHESLPGTINAFGFGYEIDSRLLTEVAAFSNGTYAFIPDAGFVGTIFVNSLSNLLCTMATDARLSLQVDEGIQISTVAGGWESQRGAEMVSIELGMLQYGQSKDVVLKLRVQKKETPVSLCASLSCNGGAQEIKCEASQLSPEVVSRHVNRAKLVDFLNATALLRVGKKTLVVPAQLQKVHAALQTLVTEVSGSPSAASEPVKALLKDMTGQCSEALSKAEYWEKWGKHYLPSVAFAHKLQQCNNFKDPGVQVYGGRIFQELRDLGDSAFNKIPPPQPSIPDFVYLGAGQLVSNPKKRPLGGGGFSQPAYQPSSVASMAYYNDRDAGCVSGDSVALLASGESKLVCELVKGDRVCGSGGTAEILCMVASSCRNGLVDLVELSPGLRLTPFHPVGAGAGWSFPLSLGPVITSRCNTVYSFVVRGAPAIQVGGIAVVALGHGLTEGVAAHPYFGTRRVIHDLQQLEGYDCGYVSLNPAWVRRDPITHLISCISSKGQ
jgi:hypothetical protein